MYDGGMSERAASYGTGATGGRRDAGAQAWDGEAIRALRTHLGDTQAAFAARLGTTQQLVSDWERGRHVPRGMTRRLLGRVAEEQGYYATPPLPDRR